MVPFTAPRPKAFNAAQVASHISCISIFLSLWLTPLMTDLQLQAGHTHSPKAGVLFVLYEIRLNIAPKICKQSIGRLTNLHLTENPSPRGTTRRPLYPWGGAVVAGSCYAARMERYSTSGYAIGRYWLFFYIAGAGLSIRASIAEAFVTLKGSLFWCSLVLYVTSYFPISVWNFYPLRFSLLFLGSVFRTISNF